MRLLASEATVSCSKLNTLPVRAYNTPESWPRKTYAQVLSEPTRTMRAPHKGTAAAFSEKPQALHSLRGF